MSSTAKFAAKIVAGSMVVLALGAAIWSAVLLVQTTAESPEVFPQLGRSGLVTAVAWSPDGKSLASASDDQTVKVWETGSGQLLRTLSDHSNFVTAVAWSPDGKSLASASDDQTVKVWEAGSGQLLRTLSGHSNRVTAVAWSPDGKSLASASYDRTVKVWEAGSGQLLRTLSDHSKVVTSGHSKVVTSHSDVVTAVAWSPDGKNLASASWDQTVKVWETRSGQLLRTLSDHSDVVTAVAWSPDGKSLASASYDRTVKLWEAESGKPLRTLSGHSNFVSAVAWSPDGKSLASASYDRTVKVWKAEGGKPRTLIGHSDLITAVAWRPDVAWSPDGKSLASANSDSNIMIWAPSSGEAERTFFLLPGNEWLTMKPGALSYTSSLHGDDYFAVRFGNRLSPIYPLSYYRKELQVSDLKAALARTQATIKPKPIRLAWEQWQNKPLWLGGLTLAYGTGLGTTLILFRRSDPAQIARQFFSRAGFAKVEYLDYHRLSLTPKAGQSPAEALIWNSDRQPISSTERDVRQVRTYFVYKGQFPPNAAMQAMRARTHQEVVPLQAASLARAVADNDCQHKLCELEEPFISRSDPYDESRPISDPVWFYGRGDLLSRTSAALRQRQHVGIFGLRKVGKTSLLNQLRGLLASSCAVSIDCQGYPPAANELFAAILKQFRAELAAQKTKNLPYLTPVMASHDFRESFLDLYEAWVQSGKQEPFILLLDEVDKLFPDRRMKNSEDVLGEWVRLFRVLRALAQEKKCLAVLVTAYRPVVNRQNLLSPAIGENPMFMSFQEYFLGPLNQTDTEKMVSEIGGWKDIRWSPAALKRTYELCGGHPLVTRLFSSDACLQGDRKQIEETTVLEAAQAVRADFHKHRIGRYYQESIWNLLQEDEKAALRIIEGGANDGMPHKLDEAVSNLEQFGIIRNQNGRYEIAATLLQSWLERSQATWTT